MAAIRSTSLLRQSLGGASLRASCSTGTRTSRILLPNTVRSYATKGDNGSSSSGSSSSNARPSAAPSGNSSTGMWMFAAAGILGAAGLTVYSLQGDQTKGTKNNLGLKTNSKPTLQDYQKVYNAIAESLEKDPNYDDGSFGPVLVRLAWHASGTYDAKTGTGGSNGATMRFAPESNHGANAGLLYARNFMEDVKKQFPWITYSDLWTLGGVVAVQELGGPTIAWRPGRSDREQEHCTPDGRLPDGDKGADHLRFIFNRMGFNDQEIVALSGAHALGRCHPDRSGFDGPWQHAPTSMTNVYYDLLLNEKWDWKKWNGPKQYADKSTGKLMMLPTDMALIQDKSFRKYVEKYAKSEDAFFEDFSKVFSKLLELGVPEDNFKVSVSGGKPITFKTTADQDL